MDIDDRRRGELDYDYRLSPALAARSREVDAAVDEDGERCGGALAYWVSVFGASDPSAFVCAECLVGRLADMFPGETLRIQAAQPDWGEDVCEVCECGFWLEDPDREDEPATEPAR